MRWRFTRGWRPRLGDHDDGLVEVGGVLIYLYTCREVILHWYQVVASGTRSTTSRVLGIDQAEAALASLRVTQEFEFRATFPDLGVVSGRGATSMSAFAAGPAPSLVTPTL